MPKLARPKGKGPVDIALHKDGMNSVSDTSGDRTGAARYLRSAFRALARPVRSKREYHNAPMLATENLSKTWSEEFYAVPETDRETYHSYLGTLSSLGSELEGSNGVVSELDSVTTRPQQPRIIMEMEDTSALYLMRQKERERDERRSPTSSASNFMSTPTAIQTTAVTSPVIRDFFTSTKPKSVML
jgi:hypothetical protein